MIYFDSVHTEVIKKMNIIANATFLLFIIVLLFSIVLSIYNYSHRAESKLNKRNNHSIVVLLWIMTAVFLCSSIIAFIIDSFG